MGSAVPGMGSGRLGLVVMVGFAVLGVGHTHIVLPSSVLSTQDTGLYTGSIRKYSTDPKLVTKLWQGNGTRKITEKNPPKTEARQSFLPNCSLNPPAGCGHLCTYFKPKLAVLAKLVRILSVLIPTVLSSVGILLPGPVFPIVCPVAMMAWAVSPLLISTESCNEACLSLLEGEEREGRQHRILDTLTTFITCAAEVTTTTTTTTTTTEAPSGGGGGVDGGETYSGCYDIPEIPPIPSISNQQGPVKPQKPVQPCKPIRPILPGSGVPEAINTVDSSD